jgi:hypothetical protein
MVVLAMAIYLILIKKFTLHRLTQGVRSVKSDFYAQPGRFHCVKLKRRVSPCCALISQDGRYLGGYPRLARRLTEFRHPVAPTCHAWPAATKFRPGVRARRRPAKAENVKLVYKRKAAKAASATKCSLMHSLKS